MLNYFFCMCGTYANITTAILFLNVIFIPTVQVTNAAIVILKNI